MTITTPVALLPHAGHCTTCFMKISSSSQKLWASLCSSWGTCSTNRSNNRSSVTLLVRFWIGTRLYVCRLQTPLNHCPFCQVTDGPGRYHRAFWAFLLKTSPELHCPVQQPLPTRGNRAHGLRHRETHPQRKTHAHSEDFLSTTVKKKSWVNLGGLLVESVISRIYWVNYLT